MTVIVALISSESNGSVGERAPKTTFIMIACDAPMR